MKDRISTKIVCTLGTDDNRDSVEMIRLFIGSGMDVARINMSHDSNFRMEGKYIPGKTYMDVAERISRVHQAAKEEDRHVAVMGDLMGQKIRVGLMENDGVELSKGQKFFLDNDSVNPGNAERAFINHFDAIVKSFVPDSMFLFSDGLIRMRAKDVKPDRSGIKLEVLDDGFLRSRQGVVLRGMSPNIPVFTKKDSEDLKFLLDNDVDFIAVSYIRSASDIVKIRGIIESTLDDAPQPAIIAKIETEDAVKDIHNIVCEADGIMIARGDLGVRMDVEDVPILQKEIIHLCNVLGKPVITATQMLESMINRPFPTRAEVSDVANAIFDGTDAVMLSGETAIGNYPVETVRIMRKIAQKAEGARFRELKAEFKKREWRNRIANGIIDMKARGIYLREPERMVSDAITMAASEIADDLNLKIILTPTKSGHTARLMSRFKPGIPIIAAVINEHVARKLALSHGVIPLMVERKCTADEAFTEANRSLLECGLLAEGELFLATSGYPVNVPGSTNLLKIVRAQQSG